MPDNWAVFSPPAFRPEYHAPLMRPCRRNSEIRPSARNSVKPCEPVPPCWSSCPSWRAIQLMSFARIIVNILILASSNWARSCETGVIIDNGFAACPGFEFSKCIRAVPAVNKRQRRFGEPRPHESQAVFIPPEIATAVAPEESGRSDPPAREDIIFGPAFALESAPWSRTPDGALRRPAGISCMQGPGFRGAAGRAIVLREKNIGRHCAVLYSSEEVRQILRGGKNADPAGAAGLLNRHARSPCTDRNNWSAFANRPLRKLPEGRPPRPAAAHQ